MNSLWYWCRNGQQYGPVSKEDLSRLAAAGQVLPGDLVWSQGMESWMPAHQVQWLFPSPDPRFPPPPPPPPAASIYPGPQYVNQQNLIQPSNPRKDPLLMGILSGCCIAGLGQMVLGQVTKGVIILIGSIALGALTAGGSIFVTWPLGGIDAYLIGKKLKDGKCVGPWECF